MVERSLSPPGARRRSKLFARETQLDGDGIYIWRLGQLERTIIVVNNNNAREVGEMILPAQTASLRKCDRIARDRWQKRMALRHQHATEA